jgi:hypothetical protein
MEIKQKGKLLVVKNSALKLAKMNSALPKKST